jgi:hypothetical protein
MARDKDGQPLEVEWLDAESPPNRAGRRPPHRAWYVLLGATGVAVVLVLALTSHPTERAVPPTTPTATSNTSSIVLPESSVPPTPPVSLIDLGRPLLNVPPTWELVARDGDAVYQIQLATGRIARTSAPISSTGVVSLVVGPDEVIVRPWACVHGYLIRDGQPASDLRGMLAHCGPALPGPRPGQVWVQTGDQDHPRMVLVGLDGRPTGVSVPGQGYLGVSDGAGYVLVDLVGGTYDARPDGLHRITSGRVLASGPTGWLAEECDDRHHCTMDVIDRRSGAHRTIGPARDDQYSGGIISPDGTLAALATQTDQDQDAILHLIDLGSGADRATSVTLSNDQAPGGGAMVWSPYNQIWAHNARLIGAREVYPNDGSARSWRCSATARLRGPVRDAACGGGQAMTWAAGGGPVVRRSLGR